MELLKEIGKGLNIQYTLRRSARTILFNEEGEVAIIYFKKSKFHQLPGGGIDDGEDIKEALKREVKEELGADIDILNEVGCIIEYRNETKDMRISYCFISRLLEISDNIQLCEREKRNGMTYKWFEIDQAMETIKNDEILNTIKIPYINIRELEFLRKGKEILENEINIL